MGAWGSGLFENDDAADFVVELTETTNVDQVTSRLRGALDAVTTADDYLELPEMSNAVAAAGVVALFVDRNLATPTGLPQEWRDAVGLSSSDEMRKQAARVLARAFEPDDNEWHALWDEAGLLTSSALSSRRCPRL